jgi:hypothetical protein
MTRYQVFSEEVSGKTHWGLYDSATGTVLGWFSTETVAWNAIPHYDNGVTA